MRSSISLSRLVSFLAVAGIGMALCWVLFRPDRDEGRGAPAEPEQGTIAGPPSDGSPVSRSRVSVTVAAARATNVLPQQLEALLGDPRQRIRMRDVPRLESAAELELVRRYEAAEGITNRYRLLRTLIFGRSRRVLPLVEDTLTHQHAGKELALGEDAMLLYLPVLLGIVAREDDETLQWLLRGAQEGYWEGVSLWFEPGASPIRPCWLRGRCIRGLAMSERQEAREFLAALHRDSDRAIRLEVDGAMVDAAFAADMIVRHGLETAMDEYLSGDNSYSKFVEWKHSTSNGIAWAEWRMKAVRAKGAGGDTSVIGVKP
jgi:hypothetical protein